MAERIEVLLRVETLDEPRNIELYWSPDLPDGFNTAFGKLLYFVTHS